LDKSCGPNTPLRIRRTYISLGVISTCVPPRVQTYLGSDDNAPPWLNKT